MNSSRLRLAPRCKAGTHSIAIRFNSDGTATFRPSTTNPEGLQRAIRCLLGYVTARPERIAVMAGVRPARARRAVVEAKS